MTSKPKRNDADQSTAHNRPPVTSSVPGMTALRISGVTYLLSPHRLQQLQESMKQETPRPSSSSEPIEPV
jgi:hypothetical protein